MTLACRLSQLYMHRGKADRDDGQALSARGGTGSVVSSVLVLHRVFLSPLGEQGSCESLPHPAGGIFRSVSVLHGCSTVPRQLAQMEKESFVRPMISKIVSWPVAPGQQ